MKDKTDNVKLHSIRQTPYSQWIYTWHSLLLEFTSQTYSVKNCFQSSFILCTRCTLPRKIWHWPNMVNTNVNKCFFFTILKKNTEQDIRLVHVHCTLCTPCCAKLYKEIASVHCISWLRFTTTCRLKLHLIWRISCKNTRCTSWFNFSIYISDTIV